MIYLFDGGLGNQLFQLLNLVDKDSEQKYYSRQFLTHRKIELSQITVGLLEKYNIKEKNIYLPKVHHYLFRFLNKVNQSKFYYLSKTCFFTELHCSYYQNVKFDYILQRNIFGHEGILNLNRSLCAIHIRGGDYLSEKNKKVYFNLTEKFYLKAIKNMVNNHNITEFMIYTNDINHAKSILEKISIDNITFLFSNNNTGESDFKSISLHKYVIMSNSTYSFWSIMSNYFEEKVVIAPQDWYIQLDYPKFINTGWIIKS